MSSAELPRPHARSPQTNPTAIGVDIGGTRIRAGRVNSAGRLILAETAPTPPGGAPDDLARALSALLTRLGPTPTEPMAIALPGLWNRDTGRMERVVNLPRLEGCHLPSLFNAACGRPVRLESDVNAAALAQHRALSPRPARFLYLSLGTGVGGAVLIDGRLLAHTRGGAGSFGFLIVDSGPDAPDSLTGVRGCLSEFASGPAIGAAGDLARAAAALAVALHQLTHLYAPETVAIGGGVADARPELVTAAAECFRQGPRRLIQPDPTLLVAPYKSDEAGTLGAGLLALEH